MLARPTLSQLRRVCIDAPVLHDSRDLSARVLSFKVCTANNAMGSLARLTGARHAQGQSSATSHDTQDHVSMTSMFKKARVTTRFASTSSSSASAARSTMRPRYYRTPRTTSSFPAWATQTFGKHSSRDSVSRGVVPCKLWLCWRIGRQILG